MPNPATFARTVALVPGQRFAVVADLGVSGGRIAVAAARYDVEDCPWRSGRADAVLFHVVETRPLEANLDGWRSLARVVGTLSASLAVVALVLALVGVYGVVAYAVGRRMHEVGIRVALGAGRRAIVSLVLGKTMRPVVVGAAAGLAMGLAVCRVLESVLFGVSPLDPLALAAALVVVLGGAAAAAIVPARRASHGPERRAALRVRL